MHKYIRTYELLKRTGHSATHAAMIIIDCKRGDAFAMTWVRLMFKMRNG